MKQIQLHEAKHHSCVILRTKIVDRNLLNGS